MPGWAPPSFSPLRSAPDWRAFADWADRRVDVLICRRAAAVFWRVEEMLCLSVRLSPSRPRESRTAATRYHGVELETDGPFREPRQK